VGTVCANWNADLYLDISFVFIRNKKRGRRCPCKEKSQNYVNNKREVFLSEISVVPPTISSSKNN